MKKLLSLILAAVMLLTLAACGGAGEPETTEPPVQTSEVPETSEAPAVEMTSYTYTFQGMMGGIYHSIMNDTNATRIQCHPQSVISICFHIINRISIYKTVYYRKQLIIRNGSNTRVGCHINGAVTGLRKITNTQKGKILRTGNLCKYIIFKTDHTLVICTNP